LISHTKRRTYIEGVEEGADENIGTLEGEVGEVWRRLHNEELHNLFASSNIIRVIESRRMRWAGHVVHIGEMRSVYNISVGKPEEVR
jgi:hypothetical protein